MTKVQIDRLQHTVRRINDGIADLDGAWVLWEGAIRPVEIDTAREALLRAAQLLRAAIVAAGGAP